MAARFGKNYAQLGAVLLLGLGYMFVLRPFFAAILFAGAAVISSWPLNNRVLARLCGRRTLAALALTRLIAVAAVKVFGERAAKVPCTVSQTVRGVMYGLLGTALVAVLTFTTSLVSVGPPIIWAGAAIGCSPRAASAKASFSSAASTTWCGQS